MKYIARLAERQLRELAATFPVVVVTGARQVGKSTLLQRLFADSHEIVVFDPVIDVENARRDPELFFANHPRPLVLDEIQYAPELVPTVKRLVDADRTAGRFLMTGSQQWGVLGTLSESLAGRAVFIDLDGLAMAELCYPQAPQPWLERYLAAPSAFLAELPGAAPAPVPLYEQLWRGFLPDAQRLPVAAVPAFHAGYQRTYIERDVRQLADVADLQQFSRFAQLAAALTAQEVNYSQFGRDLGLAPRTAERWLAILKATFQWYEIPPFGLNAVKRVSGKRKGYLADTGSACFAQAVSSHLALGGHPLLGALFETAVVGELRKQAAALAVPPRFWHWRSHGGAEVDVLLERDGTLYPIEIKVASRVSRNDTRGISALRKTYPDLRLAPGLVIAPVARALRVSDHDWALPWAPLAGPVT